MRTPACGFIGKLLASTSLSIALAGCIPDFGDDTDQTLIQQSRHGQSIGFNNRESDVIASILAAESDAPSIVFMRQGNAQRGKQVVFVFNDGVLGEAIADDEGLLGELSLDGHRFVFTNYTDTHVTVTYHSPTGEEYSEEVTRPSASLANANAASGFRVSADEDQTPERSAEEEVTDTLKWFVDGSNYHALLRMYRYAGEKVYNTYDRIRNQVNKVRAEVVKVKVNVKNELTCLTETRALCGQKTAEQTPEIVKELRSIDPNATTTAGFNVTAEGIKAKRDEWQRVSPDFTMTDVPCEESVFADMNPACPQYVEPTEDGGCEESSLGQSTYWYTCDAYYEELKEILGGWLFQRFVDSGGVLRHQFGMNVDFVEGKVYNYSTYLHFHNSSGQITKAESKTFNIEGAGRHVTSTYSYSGGTKYTTTVWLDCGISGVERKTYEQVNDDPSNTISSSYNTDRTGCPTQEDVEALAQSISPDFVMSLQFIKDSEVYGRYLQDH